MIFSKVVPRPLGMLKQVFLGRFEPVVARFWPWKIPKCLENGPFRDHQCVRNGSKTRFSKDDPRPSMMLKQVVLAHFEPVATVFRAWKIPKCLENGPFWDQKWVKNGSKTRSKSDPGPFGMLKQVFLARFEPVLTEFSPFHHMYAPSCALCTYLRAAVWSGGAGRHLPGALPWLRGCRDASPPPAELRGALEHVYSKPRHHFLVAADHGVELSDDVVALAADVVQCLAPHAMMLPREGWEGQRHDQTPAALLIARYVELGGSEAVYLDRLETPGMRHWTAHHLVAPDMRLAVDPLGRPVVSGAPPQWPHTWDMAVRTMRMAPRGQRAGWPGAEHLLAEARAAQVQQPAGNTKDCGVCALMSAVGTLLRVPRPGNLLSALDRRWVAAVVLNRDMGPIARLPSLGELPAAVLEALPAPRTPLDVANVPHKVGLPGARMQHALLCMAAAADGGMSMLATVSLQHVQDAMQQQRMHAPQPWEESAKRWLRVESVPSTHTVGVADMGRLVVLEGAEYWACVRVETGGLEWVVVTACRLRRQQSRGPACYRVFRECLSGLGPVRRAHRCTAEDIPPAPAVFVEVTRPPVIQGQDVWPIAPSNMWQAEHAAGMCRALQGHAAALPRAPAAQSSSNRPAASLALLHSASRAWYWVVAALEPHSSALRLYDRGEGTVLTVRPADPEALHHSAQSSDGGDALYLQGTVAGAAATRFRRQSGGDALRLVMAENMGPWLRAFSTSRWKVEGDREKFADAWRRWVG